jgi:hypothetical protein
VPPDPRPAELSLTGQLNDSTWIYADARYRHGLKNRKYKAKVTKGLIFFGKWIVKNIFLIFKK